MSEGLVKDGVKRRDDGGGSCKLPILAAAEGLQGSFHGRRASEQPACLSLSPDNSPFCTRYPLARAPPLLPNPFQLRQSKPFPWRPLRKGLEQGTSRRGTPAHNSVKQASR